MLLNPKSRPCSPWRRVPLGVIVALALVLSLAAGPAWTAKGRNRKAKDDKAAQAIKKDAAKAEPKSAASLFSPEHETIELTGLRCQVHRAGKICQEIEATQGRYDQDAKIFDLDQLHVKFQNDKTSQSGSIPAGRLTCGYGRIWTQDDRKRQITAHDMLLQQNVRLETAEHMVLTSPEMRYQAKDSLLHSDKGFRQQFPAGTGFMVGQGQEFKIKIIPEQNTFGYLHELGKPVEWMKSGKSVM